MSIKKNLFIQTANVLIIYLTPLILSPYISRIFGPEGIGIQSYTTAVVTLFTLFSMMGVAAYGQREIATVRDDRSRQSRLFWELVSLHSIVAGIFFVIYIIFILFSDQYRIYYIIHLLTMLGSMLDISFLYIANEKFIYVMIRNCIVQAATLIVTFGFVKSYEDLRLYILVIAAGTFFTASTLWIHVRKYVDFVRVSLKDVFSHFKSVLIFFVPAMAATAYSLLDKAIITLVTGDDAQTGYYDRAYQILVVVNFITQALATVTAPRMAAYYSGNKIQEFSRLLNRSLRFMAFITIPCAFGLFVISKTFVPVFFGPGFTDTIEILCILSPLIIITGISFYLDNLYLVPTGQRKKSAIIISIGAIANVGLSILFTFFLQARGAAIATIITELFVSVCLIGFSKNSFNIRGVSLSLVKYAIFGLVMALGVYFTGEFLGEGIITLMVQFFCGVLIYALLLLAFKDEHAIGIIERLSGKGR